MRACPVRKPTLRDMRRQKSEAFYLLLNIKRSWEISTLERSCSTFIFGATNIRLPRREIRPLDHCSQTHSSAKWANRVLPACANCFTFTNCLRRIQVKSLLRFCLIWVRKSLTAGKELVEMNSQIIASVRAHIACKSRNYHSDGCAGQWICIQVTACAHIHDCEFSCGYER